MEINGIQFKDNNKKCNWKTFDDVLKLYLKILNFQTVDLVDLDTSNLKEKKESVF